MKVTASDPSRAQLKLCPVCQQEIQFGAWQFAKKCPCGLWQSDLQFSSTLQQPDVGVWRERALGELRGQNFENLLGTLCSLASAHGKKLLEVGCARGEFMKLASENGFSCLGLEPDEAIFQGKSPQPPDIRIGFFPQAVSPEEKFDFIIFNDVFEHLEKPEEILRSCYAHLNSRGFLVISLPSSVGFLFWIARILDLIGISFAWDRLWQKDFKSPHLFYFSPKTLGTLLQRSRFHILKVQRLKTVSADEVKARLDSPGPGLHFLWKFSARTFVTLFAPLINSIFPPDIVVIYAQKSECA